MEQFKPDFKMQSIEYKRMVRAEKFKKVQENYLQITNHKTSNFLLASNKKMYGDMFDKIKDRLSQKQTARRLVIRKLLKSMVFMKMLYHVRKLFTLSIVKTSLFRMKDLQRRKIVLLMKEKCEKTRLSKKGRNGELIRAVMSIKYSLHSSSSFKFKIQKELLHRIYFINKFIDKATSFQRTFLFVKKRFRNSMTRKRFWIVFLSSRLQSLRLNISKKISNQDFLEKIYTKVLECLYLADVHSLAMASVRKYSIDSIMLKSPRTSLERFHNKMVSLIFYYFPPSDHENNFKISRLFKMKDFSSFTKTIESMIGNIYLGI